MLALRIVLFASATHCMFGQLPQEMKRKFDEAERRIVRLPPSTFRQLPAEVVQELQRRKCTIPQESYTKELHNVIRGEFAKPRQQDWAVLCSKGGVSSILVFWNGSAANPATLASMEDRNYLQGDVGDKINFSRGIRAVNKQYIMRHYDAYGGVKPPPIDHQGIDDMFIEKASTTHYFHAGKWLRLTGAD